MMSKDYTISGTPTYTDNIQESLIKLEHNLGFAIDEAREVSKHGDPLTEHGMRQIQKDLQQVYSQVLSLRTARKHQYASNT